MNKLVLVFLLALAGTASADTSAARQACTTEMNADPTFANDILRVAIDKGMGIKAWCDDQTTTAAHLDAEHHIRKNDRQVFIAYGAMWVVAALFLAFLWMRQQALKSEIAQLRRELEAAAKETK